MCDISCTYDKKVLANLQKEIMIVVCKNVRKDSKKMEKVQYNKYLQILKEELIPAMGCTEPIAIAYASALAREQLSEEVKRAEIKVSGNIIKNVKSVIVPNTGGLRGIGAAAAAGIVAGEASRELEVIADVSTKQYQEIKEFLERTPMTINESEAGYIFDIQIMLYTEHHTSVCRIAGHHTNVVYLGVDHTAVIEREYKEEADGSAGDRECLNVKDIVAFADEALMADVEETLERQISYNMAIAKAGLEGEYGARIGKILLNSYGDSVQNKAKAYAAAASDARMNGCSLPVVINSGSGNQGITASVPVVVFAEAMGASKETTYRALIVSNLVTIHLKTGIGRLSAYCGAVSAGCGAGAGITYLHGGTQTQIEHTIVNSLAINSGVICDGAKSSCAAKIASAVEAGLLGMQMYFHGSEFCGGDGIVTKGVENTIAHVGRLARVGMAQTDKEILHIMMS